MSRLRRGLLVEDDPLVRAVLGAVMEELFEEFVSVENGSDALRTLEELKFDVLVSDLRMPGAGGLDVVRAVRSKAPTTKVVVVSGYADEEAQNVLSELGVRVLHKPFGAADLREAILIAASR